MAKADAIGGAAGGMGGAASNLMQPLLRMGGPQRMGQQNPFQMGIGAGLNQQQYGNGPEQYGTNFWRNPTTPQSMGQPGYENTGINGGMMAKYGLNNQPMQGLFGNAGNQMPQANMLPTSNQSVQSFLNPNQFGGQKSPWDDLVNSIGGRGGVYF